MELLETIKDKTIKVAPSVKLDRMIQESGLEDYLVGTVIDHQKLEWHINYL